MATLVLLALPLAPIVASLCLERYALRRRHATCRANVLPEDRLTRPS